MADHLKQKDDWHLTDKLQYEHGRGDPFAAAVRATRMSMIVTDPSLPDNPIVFCNAAFQELTGYERDEIIGRNCRFLQGEGTDAAEISRMRDAVAREQDIKVDLLNYRKDGSTFWNALYLSPVRDAQGVVRFFFASQLDVTDRVEAQRKVAQQKADVEAEVTRRTAELQKALEEKTILLHEVDHRVRNNLTMIGALLRLQSRSLGDPLLSDKLNTMMERVDALATVHRRLYQSEDIAKFDLAEFAVSLATDVIGASGRDNIALRSEIVPVLVNAEHASALGLILNEVLTNSIKHGLRDGRSGSIFVTANMQHGKATVGITDDGFGMASPTNVDGLGKTLIDRLSRQSNAKVVWASEASGTSFTLNLPASE